MTAGENGYKDDELIHAHYSGLQTAKSGKFICPGCNAACRLFHLRFLLYE